jgi:hypothetical protein
MGNLDKLEEIKKDFKRRGNQYHYLCKDEPFCSVCDAFVCRTRKFGVGGGNGGFDEKMGVTIIERNPRIVYFNAGDYRVDMLASEFLRLEKVKTVLINAGAPIPINVTQKQWERIVQANLADATIVPAPDMLRTDVEEIEVLAAYFHYQIRRFMRNHGKEFMEGRIGDEVRVKEHEQRVYFRWENLQNFASTHPKIKNIVDIKKLRVFVNKEAGTTGREYQPGMQTQWFRSKLYLSWGLFDEETVEKWFTQETGATENSGGSGSENVIKFTRGV